MAYVVVIVLIGFAFDFINGFHDSANSIATIVGTRVLNPFAAVVWAAFFNFSAAFVVGTAVAKTVQSGMIDQSIVDPTVILSALLGAIAWNLITWAYGLPSSSSHALIGGYAGAAVTKAGWSAILWGDKWIKTLEFIALSPLIGMARRVRAHGRGVLDLPASCAGARGPHVPCRAARELGAVLVLARRERRAEDNGHHRRSARRVAHAESLSGPDTALLGLFYLPNPDAGVPYWVEIGAYSCIALGTLLGRLAHRAHHGQPHHEASPRRWLLRRDRRRVRDSRGDEVRNSGEHDPHDHRGDRRRRRDERAIGACAGAWPGGSSGHGS